MEVLKFWVPDGPDYTIAGVHGGLGVDSCWDRTGKVTKYLLVKLRYGE